MELKASYEKTIDALTLDLKNAQTPNTPKTIIDSDSSQEVLPADDVVTVKDSKNPLSLSTPTASAPYIVDTSPAYELSRCTAYASKKSNSESFFMAGEEYLEGYVWDTYTSNLPSFAIFNLKGNFTTIKGLLGHIDATEMNDTELQIFIDGEYIKSYTVTADMVPELIEIDVTGAKQLKIVLVNDYLHATTAYGIANMTLE